MNIIHIYEERSIGEFDNLKIAERALEELKKKNPESRYTLWDGDTPLDQK